MEQRVKTLEQEMKILKNQVQKSLLDIQEYLLGQKYATLRPEEVEETAVSRPRSTCLPAGWRLPNKAANSARKMSPRLAFFSSFFSFLRAALGSRNLMMSSKSITSAIT